MTGMGNQSIEFNPGRDVPGKTIGRNRAGRRRTAGWMGL